MRQTQSYERSLARCAESRTRADRPRVFSMRGYEWDLLDEVFAPIHSPSTETALDFLGLGSPVRTRRPRGWAPSWRSAVVRA